MELLKRTDEGTRFHSAAVAPMSGASCAGDGEGLLPFVFLLRRWWMSTTGQLIVAIQLPSIPNFSFSKLNRYPTLVWAHNLRNLELPFRWHLPGCQMDGWVLTATQPYKHASHAHTTTRPLTLRYADACVDLLITPETSFDHCMVIISLAHSNKHTWSHCKNTSAAIV